MRKLMLLGLGLVWGCGGDAFGGAASEQRLMHLGGLSAQAEHQRILTEQAAQQARLYEAPYQRLMELLRAQGGLLGGGVGLTGGTGGGGSLAVRGGRGSSAGSSRRPMPGAG